MRDAEYGTVDVVKTIESGFFFGLSNVLSIAHMLQEAFDQMISDVPPRPSSSGKGEDLWLRSQVQAPHHAKRSLVFKWRRVEVWYGFLDNKKNDEGRVHYPSSLEGYGLSKGWITSGFLGYQKK